LAASSLRHKVRLLVDDLHNMSGGSEAGGRIGVFEQAAGALRLGDLYLHRFSHFLEMLLADEDMPRVRELQILKMRLMREYSGLWLLVNASRRPARPVELIPDQ